MVVNTPARSPMEGAKAEETNTNLARVRDNQRRSRARRKEYVSELEEKFRACQQTGVEANAELQAVARSVLEENKRLRALLELHNIPIDAIDHDSTDERPTAGAAERLESLLVWRKPCQPGATPCQPSPTHHHSPMTPVRMPAREASVPQPALQTQPLDQQPVAQPFIQPDVLPFPSFDQNVYRQVQGIHVNTVPQAISQQEMTSYGTDDLHMQPQAWPMSASVTATDVHYSNGPSIPTTTTSCSSVADLIRIAKPELGHELEHDMGCQGNTTGCSIQNTRIFDIMDKYSVG